MNKLRVLIADDHEDARRLVFRLLSSEFEIVGSVADGRQLVDAAIALHPDVIVSDICMPVVTGPEAMRELKTTGLDIPFVLISVNLVEPKELAQQGATAFVDKFDVAYELVHAVCAASTGQSYFSRSVYSSLCSAVH